MRRRHRGPWTAIRRDRGGIGGGGGDECGCGRAGTERRHEHVVAVAAGVALVDDLGAGHAEVHPECGNDERADHDETERQHGGRTAQTRHRSSAATATRR